MPGPPLCTTVIGAFPKPEYLKGVVVDWFTESSHNGSAATKATNDRLGCQQPSEVETLLTRATTEVFEEQAELGVDVVTDGEVRRENYIHYLCRFIDGISFEELTRTGCRPSSQDPEAFAYHTELPTVVGPVSWSGRMALGEEFARNRELCGMPSMLKYTLPGPMTIMGSTARAEGIEERILGRELAILLRDRVGELVAAGCKQIQIDEPLFARRPEMALECGIEWLDTILEEVPEDVFTTVHICCGYPTCMDQQDYLKADGSAYMQLAPALDASRVKAVSLEDAHKPNDLSELLPLFRNKTVVLGCVAVADSRVESQQEIEGRIQQALKYIDRERLVVAPDCGLGFFQDDYRPLLNQKLANMCAAARSV